MSNIEVIPVGNSHQQKQFLDLPFEIYRNDRNWVPRIRASEKELVGFAQHPFNLNATSQSFIAIQDRAAVGRVVAINNLAHQSCYPDQNVGFIGFFECVDNDQVARLLFQSAFKWLKQQGLSKVRGPVSPSMNYEAGLLIDGFGKPPTFMMPYNPTYYSKFWEAEQFYKIQDLFAFRGNKEIYQTATKAWRIADEAANRFGATFRRIDKSNFLEDVRTFLRLYNIGSASTWGFVPFTEPEIEFLAKELRHLIIPELTSFMLVDGKTVGATFGLLDYSPLIRSIKGRLFPFGFLRILFGRQRIRKSRCMSINVLPEYQKWGLGICLLDRFLRQGYEKGIANVEFSYVLESNHLAASTLTNAGVLKEKTYRIYERRI